ncbi:potassium voltage-gated channel protein Shaker-like isoform X2 [Acropora palmata]|uniref:potassium voltage-gated channel protein Shaker-like isoform X2 n=1 Tax=Acropora palmata TaxID=6131 RepID=UPI003DA139F0
MNGTQRASSSNENRGAKVVINVSGQRYETFEKTLQVFPNTLLGDKERRKEFYDPVNNELFFDRNRVCFESILAYYQTSGVIIWPPGIPRKVFISDIRFFDLGDQALLKAGNGLEQRVEKAKRPLPKNNAQRKVWELFEHPDTSSCARAIAIWSVTIIVLSIVLFCVETLPQFQDLSVKKSNGTSSLKEEEKKTEDPFFIIETFCISWFTLEYVIRFVCCPNKWKFFISALNMIDLISIVPYYITLSMEDSSNVSSLAVLRSVRLVRVFRIFKLSRYSRGLQILGHTLKASLRELGLLFFFLCMGVILFSSAVYYAEVGNEDNNDFLSIPHSFWWAIITMTTVGYGDMTPKTLASSYECPQYTFQLQSRRPLDSQYHQDRRINKAGYRLHSNGSLNYACLRFQISCYHRQQTTKSQGTNLEVRCIPNRTSLRVCHRLKLAEFCHSSMVQSRIVPYPELQMQT